MDLQGSALGRGAKLALRHGMGCLAADAQDMQGQRGRGPRTTEENWL